MDDARNGQVILQPTFARSTATTATGPFMPKPISAGDNGSGMGMHIPQRLWKGATNLFWDEKGYGARSSGWPELHRRLLRHDAPDLAWPDARDDQSSASRLSTGLRRPASTVYSSAQTGRPRPGSRSNPRVPKSKRGGNSRLPDPSTHPYYAYTPSFMAGLDGHPEQDRPRAPRIDQDIYDLEPKSRAQSRARPGNARARCLTASSATTLAPQGRTSSPAHVTRRDHLQAQNASRPRSTAARVRHGVLPLLWTCKPESPHRWGNYGPV